MARTDVARQAVATARKVSESLMPDVATVETYSDGTFDPDDPGSTGEGWTTTTTTTGRAGELSDRGSDRMVAEQHDIVNPVYAALPIGTTVAVGNRVTVGDIVMIARVVQEPTYDAHLRVIGERGG